MFARLTPRLTLLAKRQLAPVKQRGSSVLQPTKRTAQTSIFDLTAGGFGFGTQTDTAV